MKDTMITLAAIEKALPLALECRSLMLIMSRLLPFLLVTLPLTATPVFIDSGSASVTCHWVGDVAPPGGLFDKTYAANGTAIDLSCPASEPLYQGPFVHGSAGSLAVVGNGGGGAPIGGTSSYDFQSQGTDTVTIGDGFGPGTLLFKLDFAWDAFNDVGAGNQAQADFWFNGVEVWSAVRAAPYFQPPFPRRETITLTEPFQFGVPFTYQAHVEISGSGWGSAHGDSALAISFTDPPTDAPEPGYFWLVAGAIILGVLQKGIRSSCKP